MRSPVVVGLVALALVGCAGSETSRVVLDPADSGTVVEVDAGTLLVLELEENPSTGYAWTVTAIPDALQVDDDRFDPPDGDLVGAPGTRVLTVEASARGAGVLRAEYVRPFDDDAVPERVVEFVVRVDGAPWPPDDPGPRPSTTTATADVTVDVGTLLDGGPGAVEVRGFVVWGDDARLCAALLESFPAQCGGAAVVITNPEALVVTLDGAEGIRWTASTVVVRGSYDGESFTLD